MSAWTTTSIAPRFLVAVLDAANRPVDDLLKSGGLSRDQLATADCRMPLDAFRALWMRAASVDPDIGITLVEHFPEGQMHIAAHLALRSATVEAAIADVCRYVSRMSSRADALDLTQDSSLACYRYTYRAPGPANPWMAEHILSMSTLFLSRACGRTLPIRAVEFASAPIATAESYRRRFGVDPRFNATRNALYFDIDVLGWPLLTHDAYLHAILERVAQAQDSEARTLPERARQHLADALLRGRPPTIAALAESLRLSPRALRDRLATSDTNFRILLDATRRDLARDHLTRGLSINETAFLLGFSEPAALQHACRRWFGRTAGDMADAARTSGART